MTITEAVGRSTGGKPINLAQLEAEFGQAGLAVPNHLGLGDERVYTYDAAGIATDFAANDAPTADQVIANHVGMRNKTTEEYAAEFQNPDTPPARKQEIRDIQNGLLPPEQVPMP